MLVNPDSYEYVKIKIANLNRFKIKDEKFADLIAIRDGSSLLNKVNQYFPGIRKFVKNLNLIELERAFYTIYFQEYNKVLTSSPYSLQRYLLIKLQNYEIWNLKVILEGDIRDDKDKIFEKLILEPEIILNRLKFIKELIECINLDEIVDYLRNTKYKPIIEEVIHYIKETKDKFLLESLLDHLHQNELIDVLDYFKGNEKRIIQSYIELDTFSYNIKLIYRCILNDIPIEIFDKLIVEDYAIFRKRELEDLYHKKDIGYFKTKLIEFLKIHGIRISIDSTSLPVSLLIKHVIKTIEHKVMTGIYANVDYSIKTTTIRDTLNFLITREKEIFKFLELFVKIFHKIDD